MELYYFDDFEVGQKVLHGEYVVTKEEIIQFATKWDPMPFHTDEKAANGSVYGGLTASGCHVMSIRTWLLHHGEKNTRAEQPRRRTVIIAALGWDELRFPNPVRPGDRLSLTRECIDKRESRSKPDRGIVQQLMTVMNQNGDPVLTHKDTILVAKRPQ